MIDKSRPCIFLIEDDETMINLLVILLNLENFITVKIEKEETDLIISQIMETKPDLILMDIYLNKLSGLDILKEIRSKSDLLKTKIIISSGSDMKDFCLSNGADGFILKPYMPEELIKMIHFQLEQ
jgi:DNA-binding response OmpR family regulator